MFLVSLTKFSVRHVNNLVVVMIKRKRVKHWIFSIFSYKFKKIEIEIQCYILAYYFQPDMEI